MADIQQLRAISPLDGRYSQRLTALAPIFSEAALMKYRVQVEIEYLIAFLAYTELVKISPGEIDQLRQIVADFNAEDAAEVKQLESTYRHDVKAIEYFLQQKFQNHSFKQLIPYIHIGLTSEDINSCAIGLQLDEANKRVVIPALEKLLGQLLQLIEQSADAVMLARTHGQPAVPTTLGKELAVFASRLHQELTELRDHQFFAKLGGAVGNWNALVTTMPEKKWPEFATDFIDSLGLAANLLTTQIVPAENYSRYFQTISRIQAIIIDCDHDCWQYISDGYLVQQVDAQQVGSSTMPQKVNPIDFENSEGNAGLAIALSQHFCEKLPISRLQRDLSDSTVKRSFGTAISHALLAISSLEKGLSKVSANKKVMADEVGSHPEVLAEALQTALRLAGNDQAYDQIKEKTRGKAITLEELHAIAEKSLPKEQAAQFKQLDSKQYRGLAEQLARQTVTTISTDLVDSLSSTSIKTEEQHAHK